MGRDGFEPSKQVAADLQSVPLATRESAHVFNYDTCIVYHNICDYASIFFNYSEPHAHSQNRTILVLYRRYAANFAHMCGGSSNSYYFFKLKKTACDRLPFRRRYFYYGV